MGGATTHLTRWRSAAGGVAVVVTASVAAWAAAHPQAALAATVVRALADCAAVVTLGLSAVPMLDARRYRDELAGAARRPLTVAAAAWLFAEACRLVVGAAMAAGVSTFRVGLTTTTVFAAVTAEGRSGLFSVVAAVLVLLVAQLGPTTPPVAIATLGITAVGIVARTVGGHMSVSPVGGIAVAVHALAAALWCGTLAAMVLTVDHRGQWARMLPRFSELSLLCVIALLAGGLTGGFVALDSPSQLFASGYGRLLLIKIVLTVVLMVLAWRNRARWLPAAKSHRVTAYVSRARSLTELAIMAVALTMAAALAIAG